MPPQNISVKGVIAGLNQAESLKQLQKDLDSIQDKLKLQISNININKDSISTIQQIADNLERANKSGIDVSETITTFTSNIKQAGDTLKTSINDSLAQTQKLGQDANSTLERYVTNIEKMGNELRLTFSDGEVWTKTTEELQNVKEQIFTATDAANRFKLALNSDMKSFSIDFLDAEKNKVKGMQAVVESMQDGVLQKQTIRGDANGNIVFPSVTEQISKQQEALQKANAMFEQYINALDELSQRGIVSQQDLLKAEDLVWSQFASIAEGTTKSIAPVKQAFDDLISTEKTAIAQVEKGDAQLTALMDKIVGLKGNRTVDSGAINSMESSALSLFGSGDLNAIKNVEAEMAKYQDQMNMVQLKTKAKAENDQKDFAAQQKAIKDEEALRKQDLADFQNSINEKIKVIKTLQQTQIISAQQALNQLRTLYTQNVGDVRLSTNQELDIVKAMYAQEENIAKQSAEKQASTMKNAFSPMNHTGFGMGPLGMAGTMVSFEASLAVLDNFKQGLVDVGQGAAGIQQVFQNQIQTQQQLNQVTNQFIAIAQKYGVSITDVTSAAKLWGRQYKDVNEALMLTNNSTLLSIVDNLDVSNANRSVESSINAMTKEFNNYGSAVAMSTKLVDSWSAVSHEASVSASDLTQGFERSAAAANVAGLNIDQLNSLIAASVRNTGRSGATMGNMWKSVLSNIDSMSPKVQEAFKQLGISLTQVGANGQQEMKPMWDILNQLAEVTSHANDTQAKYLTTIAGGKYQYDSMTAALSNTKTLTSAFQDSLTSQGKAAELAAAQLGTVHAQLQRLADDIQKFAYNAGSSGLSTIFVGLLKGIGDLFQGLQNFNPMVTVTIAALLGVVPVTNAIAKSFGTMSKGITNFANIIGSATTKAKSFFLQTSAASVTSSEQSVAAILAEATAKSNLVKIEDELMLTTKQGNLVKLSDVLAMTQQERAALGLASAEAGLAGETKSLMTVFGLFDITAGGLLGALAGVAAIAGTVAIAWGASTNSADQQAQSTNELTQAYEQNQKKVDALLKTYSQLSQVTKNGSVFKDSAQEQQYYSTMSDIAGILPGVTTLVDANGRVHIQNADAIKQEVDYQKQLIQLNAEKATNDFSDNYQKNLDSLKKYQQELVKAQSSTNDLKKGTEDFSVVSEKAGLLSTQSTKQIKDNTIDANTQIITLTQTINNMYASIASQMVQAQGTFLNDQNQGFLKKIIGDIDWSKFQNDTQRVTATLQGVASDLASAQNSAKDGNITFAETAAIFDKWSKVVPTVSSAMQDFGGSTTDAKKSASDFNDAEMNVLNSMDDEISKVKDLNDAIAIYNSGKQLSFDQIMKLVKEYPDLQSNMSIEHGQLVLNKNAVVDYRNNAVSGLQDVANQQLAGVAAQHEALVQELSMYDIQIAKIESVAQAQAALTAAMGANAPTQDAAGNPIAPSNAAQDFLMQYADAAQKINSLVKNAVTTGLNASNDAVQTKLNKLPKSKNPAGTVNPLTDFTDNHPDPFTDQIAQQEAALKESQSVMALYNSTSQQYRAELQKQIEILKEKQNSIKGEINWTNQNISALEKLASSEKKTSQRDATIKEINKEKTSVITLTGTYYDLQKQINDTNNTLTKDSQQAFFDKLNASVVKTTTTIDNLKSALDLMQNSGSGDSQQQLDVMNKLSDAYAQNLTQINSNISALEHESTVLKENSDAWTQNQTELQKWQSQQVTTAQSIKSLEGQYMTDAINVMNQMKQQEVDALTAQEQGMQDTIKNLQDQGKQFDMSDWNSNLQDVSNTLNEIDSRFDASPFIDSTGTVRNNLSYYDSQLQEIASVVNSMTSSSSTDENGLFGQIQNEVSYANQLKSQLDDVNVAIKQNTLAYKQQEDQLNEQIKTETQNYDDQIKALQQKSSILDQQFNQEDRLQQLEDEQTKLDQAMQDKKFSYIDSQGKEIFTFDQSTVNSIKQEQDKLLEQFQRQDIKDSIQAQIDALNTAKDQTTTTLQTQLDNMKNIHQAELQSQQDYASTLSGLLQGLNSDVQTKSQQLSQLFSNQKTAIDQSWTEMENAVKNGTLDISSVMSPNSPWYQNTIGTLKQLNVDVSAQISQLLSVFSQINSLNSLIAPVMTGLVPGAVPPVAGASGGGGAPQGYLNSYWQGIKNTGGAYANPSANGMTLQQQIQHEASLYGISPSQVQVQNGQTFVPWNLVQNHATQQSASEYASQHSGSSGGSSPSGGSSNTGSSSSNSSSSGSVADLSHASNLQQEDAFNNALNNGGTASTANGRTTLYDKAGKAIATFHEGGIVGSVANPMTDLVNKLFNTQPNEQIIKSLVGELQIPPDNITKNFIPNMQALAGSVVSNSQPNQIVNQYDLHDFTVQSNDPTDFLNQINHLVVSERR